MSNEEPRGLMVGWHCPPHKEHCIRSHVMAKAQIVYNGQNEK